MGMIYGRVVAVLLLTLLIFSFTFAFSVRYGDHKDFYRIVFQTDKEVYWKLKEFKKEKVIVFTLKDKYDRNIAELEKEINNRLKNYVREIKIVKNDGIVKIIIKPKKHVTIRAFKLNEPYRIVLDFFPSEAVMKKILEAREKKKKAKAQAKKTKKEKPKTKVVKKKPKKKLTVEDIIAAIINEKEREIKKGKTEKKSVKKTKKSAKKHIKKKYKALKKKYKRSYVKKYKHRRNRKIVIVLDPGHGGRDPGATANGLREKDINLKIARRIKFYLERDGRFKVYMTRYRDVFVPLSKRSLIAIEKNADLFISIHCNSLKRNRRWNGTYIYTLNLRGAKSKLARIVQNRENKRVIKFVKVSSNKYVNRIVADLAIYK